jgi:hypothetical protein
MDCHAWSSGVSHCHSNHESCTVATTSATGTVWHPIANRHGCEHDSDMAAFRLSQKIVHMTLSLFFVRWEPRDVVVGNRRFQSFSVISPPGPASPLRLAVLTFYSPLPNGHPPSPTVHQSRTTVTPTHASQQPPARQPSLQPNHPKPIKSAVVAIL